jgi:hypothetical protein
MCQLLFGKHTLNPLHGRGLARLLSRYFAAPDNLLPRSLASKINRSTVKKMLAIAIDDWANSETVTELMVAY